MPKQETLKRIENDIRDRDLGKARDRLQGLVVMYPDDLSLRSRLAEVYWELHYPAMAGQYWYLDKVDNEHKRTAVATFEKECGYSSHEIMRRLRLRFDPEQLEESYAKERILTLARRSGPWSLAFHERKRKKASRRPRGGGKPESRRGSAVAAGVAMILLVLAIFGFIFVLQLLKRAIS
jgi:hypothetical protein